MRPTFSLITIACLVILSGHAAFSDGPRPANNGVQIRVTVFDAEQHIPLELARVALFRENRLIVQEAANPAGQILFRDIQPGAYKVTAWFVGYRTFTDTILIDEAHSIDSIGLHSEGTAQKEVEVVGQRGSHFLT